MTTTTAQDDAGVLYTGGRIRTLEPTAPGAEALATRGGRILVVGSEQDCRRALGFGDDQTTGVVDLNGETLLPGFNDAHLHPVTTCFTAYHLDLSEATCVASVLDALADRAKVVTPGEWVVGMRLTADQLSERRLPTIAELDAVGNGTPIVVLLRDGHTSVGNSVALATAGIRADRAAPLGGIFDRDDRGQLTGICQESATGTLLAAVPLPELDELRPVAKQLFADLTAQGLTSLGVVLQTDEEGLTGPAGALESVGMMVLGEEMLQGSHAILCGALTNATDLRASSWLHRPEENRIVGGIKLYLDGCLGGRTAAMHDAYADAPGTCGMFTMNAADAARRMEAAHLAGLQVCVHAVGDAANARAVGLFTDLLTRHPPDPANPPCHRVEHASVLDAATAEGFAAIGVAAVVQPPSVVSGAHWLGERLGPERAPLAYPFRTLMNAGVAVAGSSDAPIEATDPIAGISAAVTRSGYETAECLTPDEAVALYTRNAAMVQRRDAIVGTLAEGKRADLVILSGDPAEVAPERIADIQVRRTIIGGELVYSAPAAG